MRTVTTMKGSQNDQGPSSRSIDDLPDELLLHILTFLPFETAWQTRLLSTRWRRLPIPLRSLEVDAGDFKPDDRFFLVLSQFLMGHASAVDSFRLKVTLGDDSEERFIMVLWTVVVVAVNKAKEVCLEIHRRDDPTYFYTLDMDPLYCGSIERLTLIRCVLIEPLAPTMPLSLLKSLSLESSVLIEPLAPTMPLSLLKSLSLGSISLYEWQLSRALDCCPCLESLSLNEIKGESAIMQIHAPQLRRLEILESSFFILEIVAPSLTSLEFNCFCEEEGVYVGICANSINAGECRRLKELKACSGAILALGREPCQFVELQNISILSCASKTFHLPLDIVPVAGSSRSLREICIDEWVTLYYPNKSVEAFDLYGMQSVAFRSFHGEEDELETVRDTIALSSSLKSLTITLDSMEESRWDATMSELRDLQTRHPRVTIDVLPTKK